MQCIKVNNLRYADDAVFITNRERKKSLRILDILQDKCRKFKMEIHVKKTNAMVNKKMLTMAS